MEPLVSIFRANCQSHWLPGSDISVDEMMIRFFGRSKHTQKMLNKPIKKGFKMWASCDRGYLYTFLFHSRFWKTGELEKHPLLPETQSVVYQLALALPTLPNGHTYTIYLDNLFTSTPLFRELKVVGIGACGTTRATSSPDFPAVLHILKESYGTRLPWGTLVAIPVDGVLCLGWIDNNTVLSLSTVHTVNQVADNVRRWRKRPQETSINAANARKPFNGLGARAELEIPRYIDEYNFNMGGVDIADQHRSAYKTQRKALRNWYPHWYWMLDHAIINAFKIAVYTPGNYWTKRGHKDFRELLWQELFQFQRRGDIARETSTLGSQRLDPSIYHTSIKLSENQVVCAWCSHQLTLERSRSRSPKKRSFGNEISANLPYVRPEGGRAHRTMYGCHGCQVHLCGVKQRDCWYRWHGVPEDRSNNAKPN